MQPTNDASLQTSTAQPTHDLPVIAPGHTLASITDKITSIVLRRDTPLAWAAGLAIASTGIFFLVISVAWLLAKGTGVWGIQNEVGWGFAIINFVWWIGIGHAGTLISAILLLLNQQWRTSINRAAEAMTLFAVACAGMFPLLHVGRPWLAFWLFPIPNTMGVWPQFRSPLLWDVFAVSTYATVSALFWFTGLIPDLATLRDQAKNVWAKRIFGMLSLGWRGAAMHWERYEIAYLILAGLSTPLVVSVHTVVSFDFAVSIVPGWHATILPPYFVAGAIYSGFAMVLTLMIPLRSAFGFKDFITDRHLNNMAKVMLATGLIVAYGYVMEAFFAWYSAAPYELAMIHNRMFGAAWKSYWALILFNVAIPQLLWLRRVRLNPMWLFMISIVVNIGMWLERYVIVVTSLERDFMPSAWADYYPTKWDVMLYIGTIGFFFFAFFLFIRFLPSIAIFEMKSLVPRRDPSGTKGSAASSTKEGAHHQ